MKQLILWGAMLLPFSMFAQDETLFKNAEVIGGFGGPIVEFSQINGEVGTDVGGGGALILNNFFIGGYGMGTTFPEIKVENKNYTIDFGHGGFWLGYAHRSPKLVHLYGSARLGWGGIQLKEDPDQDDEFAKYDDAIFVLTPELGVELNVTQFFKIAATGGYRWVADVDGLPGELDSSSFSSPVGTLTFRFGGFGNY